MNVTKKFKGFAIIGTVLAGLSMFSTNAFAVSYNWSPQNTVEPISLVTTSLTFKDNKSNTVSCNTITAKAEAPVNGNASVAQTTDSSGTATAPSFSNCTSNLGSASVSCTTPWVATATSLTTVDVSNVACTITVTSLAGTCTITAGTSTSPVHVNGNSWTSSTSQLAANSAASFPISESSAFLPCDGATTSTESGTVQIGATAGSVTIVQV